MRQAQREPSEESLQLGVLRFSFPQDGNVGVGIFPQRERIVVGGECSDAGDIRALRGFRLQRISTRHAESRQRSSPALWHEPVTTGPVRAIHRSKPQIPATIVVDRI